MQTSFRKPVRDEHSSLFCPTVADEGKSVMVSAPGDVENRAFVTSDKGYVGINASDLFEREN